MIELDKFWFFQLGLSVGFLIKMSLDYLEKYLDSKHSQWDQKLKNSLMEDLFRIEQKAREARARNSSK